MALWQYTFQILHLDNLKDLDILYSENEVFDFELFWQKYPLKRSFFNDINSILSKNKSWSNQIDLYGTQDSNCLEVHFDSNEDVESVSFRMDYRNDYQSILKQIIDFCTSNGLTILDENVVNIPLEYESIRNIIEESSQKKMYNKLIGDID